MIDQSLHSIQLHGWLRRIRDGDMTAYEELMLASGDRLERLARRMLRQFPNVRRQADTGDVCQETAIRLLRSLRQLDPPPATVRDFFRLAAAHIRRELLDLARRYGAAKRRGEISLNAEQRGSGWHPVMEADDHVNLECWQRFHEEVEKLPSEEREVVGLRFYHGWTEAEIAELFGVSERTVRRRWASGCIRLSNALGGEWPVP